MDCNYSIKLISSNYIDLLMIHMIIHISIVHTCGNSFDTAGWNTQHCCCATRQMYTFPCVWRNFRITITCYTKRKAACSSLCPILRSISKTDQLHLCEAQGLHLERLVQLLVEMLNKIKVFIRNGYNSRYDLKPVHLIVITVVNVHICIAVLMLVCNPEWMYLKR